MKEFLSKFTYGFLMAQLLPGFIFLESILMNIIEYKDLTKTNFFLFSLCKRSMINITNSYNEMFLFFLASVFFGMLIHGIHWAILACLENQNGKRSARNYCWHKQRVIFQILYMPILMVWEIILLLKSKNIDILTMDENVPYFNPTYMSNYNFLSEFYLNFGQFFSHTAYSLLFSFPFLLNIYIKFSYTTRDIIIYLLIQYFIISIMIILGRVQLGTLFKAEIIIVEESKKNKSKN